MTHPNLPPLAPPEPMTGPRYTAYLAAAALGVAAAGVVIYLIGGA